MVRIKRIKIKRLKIINLLLKNAIGRFFTIKALLNKFLSTTVLTLLFSLNANAQQKWRSARDTC